MRTCLRFINDFLCCTCSFNLTSFKACLTVMSNNNLHISNRSCFVVANAVPNQPSVTRVTQSLFSRFARSFGCLPLCLSISPPTSFLHILLALCAGVIVHPSIIHSNTIIEIIGTIHNILFSYCHNSLFVMCQFLLIF